MPAFKFTKVNPGDVLTIDYDLSSIGDFVKINAILSAGITGTWSSDYKKFTVNTISGNSTIDLNVYSINWSSLSIGSTFYLGKYQVASETPWVIEWEIVHQESNYQIAMAKQILDLRCFDAKESSNSNSKRQTDGNNNWQYSNIEQWLNSDQSNWYSAQHSADAPPSSANVWQSNSIGYNPYDTKPGFLYYWSDEEKAVLQDMTLTLANSTVDGGGSYTWTGKIWLPTYTQMCGNQNNSISEGTQFSKFTDNASRVKTIHAMCAANNQYCIDKRYAEGTAWIYWMSSAYPSNSYSSRRVLSGGDYYDNYFNAYGGLIGIVPCIRVPR